MDQLVYKLEREIDWVQEDHIDWGFKATGLFGIDYRYTTAGGVFSQQLLYHNNFYGFDPVEFWAELYIPRVFEGMVIRLGRWIACPDIEAQYAPTTTWPATRSCLLMTHTPKLDACSASSSTSETWFKARSQSGTDMATWYVGALPTGFLRLAMGVREQQRRLLHVSQ